MGEHSHGPWRARFFGGKWCVLHKGGDDRTILAECGTQADAQIMASALDMLEVLLSCLEHCEKEGGSDVAIIVDDNSGHMLDVEMIRTVIARAIAP